MRITTLKQFREFAQTFDWDKFAFDTETTSLDWWELDIEGISLYDGQNVCYIDLVDNGEKSQILRQFWLYLDFSKVKTVLGHYLSFDFKVLIKFMGSDRINEILSNVTLIDTQVAALLIDERESTKLKGEGGCCERFLNRKAKTYDEVKDVPRDSDEFVSYAEDDAINCWDLWQVEEPIIKEQKLEKVLAIDCNFVPVKVALELNGVLIDQDLLKHLEYDLDTLKCELEEQIIESLGPNPICQSYFFGTPIEEIGLTSHVKVKKLVKEKFGVILESTDKEHIEKCLNIHPFFPLYRKWKVVNKLLNTYVSPCWGRIKPDGRIHPSYRTLVSGREETSKPNLQNQAKENEIVPEVNIRKLYIAQPGYKLLRIDYSGQEMRLAAHNCNDKNMIRAFENEWDVHLFVANRVLDLGIKEDYLWEQHEKYKEVREYFDVERTRFKTVNFGIIYGKVAASFAEEWNVPIWEAQKTLNGFFRLFPAIKKGIQDWKAWQKQHLYTSTWLGRRRRFDKPVKSFDYRAGFNHTCQGGGADMMKKAARETWEYLLKQDFEAKIILIVHDELILEAPEDKIELLVEPVSNIMVNTMKLRCPLKVESKIVDSYGD